MSIQSALAIDVQVDATTLEASICDSRSDIVKSLIPLDEGQRRGFVADTWTVGVRAIMNAHRNAEESRLADVGKTILADQGQAEPAAPRRQGHPQGTER